MQVKRGELQTLQEALQTLQILLMGGGGARIFLAPERRVGYATDRLFS